MILFCNSVLASLSALLIGAVLLWFKPRIARFTQPRCDTTAVQCSHVGDPLRIGGVAILAAIAFVITSRYLMTGESLGVLLVLSLLPVLAAGLAEDLGYHISPRSRFLAAIVSAFTAFALLDLWAPRSDVPGLDLLMSLPLIAIFLTIIFSAIFCHAVNLIDGMNGLAATIITTSAFGGAAVAMMASLPEIATLGFLLAAATVGFFTLNWPHARLFLGDAGAYGLGHLLIWLMIMIAWYSDAVAIPALLLVLFWPLADVSHTVARRFAARAAIMQPDRMHLHQKIRRMLDLVCFGYQGRQRSNPLTTLIMSPFIAMPVVLGVLLWNNTQAAWAAFGLCLLCFAAAHHVTARLACRYRGALVKRDKNEETWSHQS